MECVGELKLIAELIEARGIAGMREAISNTAELGAVLGGPRIVDDRRPRAHGANCSPRSAPADSRAALGDEADGGYPRLKRGSGAGARATRLEETCADRRRSR